MFDQDAEFIDLCSVSTWSSFDLVDAVDRFWLTDDDFDLTVFNVGSPALVLEGYPSYFGLYKFR